MRKIRSDIVLVVWLLFFDYNNSKLFPSGREKGIQECGVFWL